MSPLVGKRFVVTGSASGIGDATVRHLAAAGASVISLDRNTPSAPVEQHIDVDLSHTDSIDAATSQIEGTIDGLLNVAGVPGTLPAEVVLAVNFLGMRHLTESLLDRINPGGSIVIVSSTAGFHWPSRLETIKQLLATTSFAEGASWFAENPQEGNAYDFSKEVATVYTMSNALAMVQRKLRINAVLPGPVETPILGDFEESMGKEMLDGVRALVGRHASSADIASTVVFLVSDESRWMNGHPLVVDGGITAAFLSGTVPIPQ